MKVFPVVHVNEPSVAVEQAHVALELNADGVYLIDHHADSDNERLFQTFSWLTAKHPDSYVGMNVLNRRPLDALRSLLGAFVAPSALWADDAKAEPSFGAVKAFRDEVPFLKSVRYLGGVSFKYTPDFTEDPEAATRQVAENMDRVDVVVTSGAGTGNPPTVAKIKAMKEAAGTLAVASGISLENMEDYAGLIDEVLVASSVETVQYSGIFDTKKLGQFIDMAHEL